MHLPTAVCLQGGSGGAQKARKISVGGSSSDSASAIAEDSDEELAPVQEQPEGKKKEQMLVRGDTGAEDSSESEFEFEG